MDQIDKDIAAVQSIQAVPKMLNLICRTTGMRVAAVARVTEERWVACSVRDDIAFGLEPGGELKIENTICHEIKQSGKAVIIDHVAEDPVYCSHHVPLTYGLQSYISMPILLTDGTFFGTLCAIDPEPRVLNTPETIEMFEMFAGIIGYHLSTIDRMNIAETSLAEERRSSALREEFIAVLGHDLRNPLTGIHGGMQLLKKMKLDEKPARIVDMIYGSAERMARLIENVMDFARGRLGGGLSLNRDDLESVEPILRQVVEELLIGAPGRVVEAHFDIAGPVNCDRRRIAQLASNLLGNALLYGAPDRPVIFSAKARNGWFEIFVANAGDPIPAHVLKTIFEPFHRGELSHGREGLGLGLYISHEIATSHGGRLEVTSTAHETRFTFRMPMG